MQFANYFFKNLAYVLGIYLGVGSILQSVKRICKLKKANFLNGNEQIAMFRNDRNKKIIALAVFILSYFVFYLFKCFLHKQSVKVFALTDCFAINCKTIHN